jgi:hypothetical protein
VLTWQREAGAGTGLGQLPAAVSTVRQNDEGGSGYATPGMTVLMEVDGAVYLPAGQTITGLPIVVAEETNKLMWAMGDLDSACAP